MQASYLYDIDNEDLKTVIESKDGRVVLITDEQGRDGKMKLKIKYMNNI